MAKKIKVTKESKELFINTIKKHTLHKEGFIANLLGKALGRYVKKALEKDADFNKAVKDGDAAVEKLKKDVQKMKKLGMEIPDWMKPFDN